MADRLEGFTIPAFPELARTDLGEDTQRTGMRSTAIPSLARKAAPASSRTPTNWAKRRLARRRSLRSGVNRPGSGKPTA